MGARKKTFPCGHVGRGRYCHRCRQAEQARQAKAAARQAWQARLADAPVSLGHLPRSVAEAAMELIAQLEQGRPYHDFKGKRLVNMNQHEVLSIPLGRRYRLICRERPTGGLEYLEVLSHEDYNQRLASGGWRKR